MSAAVRRPVPVLVVLVLLLTGIAGLFGGTTPPARAAECDPAAAAADVGPATVVVLVHGIASSAEEWSSGSPSVLDSLQQLPDAYVTAFDYAPAADRWVTDNAIGPALARTVSCLADASAQGGGSGRVLLVGSSTGGLAIRCALAEACGGVAGLGQQVGSVITVGTPNTGMQLTAGDSVTPTTPLWGVCRALSGRTDVDPVLAGGCDYLDAVAGSPAAAALVPGSAELADLPPYPAGLPVQAVAARTSFETALFDYRPPSADPPGDLLVGVDSATAGGTEPTPTVLDCGAWRLTAGSTVGVQDGGCRAGAEVGSPVVDQALTGLVTDYVARNRCGLDLAADEVTQAIAQVPLPNPDWPWDTGYRYGNYDRCAALSGVTLIIEGATASSPMQVLLFSYGRYLGTGTSEPYGMAEIDTAASTRDTVVVRYRYLRPWDSGTAGTSGQATVRYRWDGTAVTMLDQLPADMIEPPPYPTISLEGFGPFRWGDSRSAAEEALGLNTFVLNDLGGGCAQAELFGVFDTTFGIQDGVVFGASVSGNMVVTDTGIRIGDPVAKLRAAYPGIESGPDIADAFSTRYQYTSGGRTATFVSYNGDTVDWMIFGLENSIGEAPCV